MTRPRLSRAERQRLARRRRAEAEERQRVMIERDLATIETLTRTALLTQIAYNKGRIPKARCEVIVARLTRELDAMRDARAQAVLPDR